MLGHPFDGVLHTVLPTTTYHTLRDDLRLSTFWTFANTLLSPRDYSRLHVPFTRYIAETVAWETVYVGTPLRVCETN